MEKTKSGRTFLILQLHNGIHLFDWHEIWINAVILLLRVLIAEQHQDNYIGIFQNEWLYNSFDAP